MVLVLVAIGLGRFREPNPLIRTPFTVQHVYLGNESSGARSQGLTFLNLANGRVQSIPLPDEHTLEVVSLAPWRDERGRGQMAGRWIRRRCEGIERIGEDFGLGRYSFPDGQVINQVATDVLPTSPPCWLPGPDARIVFVSGNGRLYRFAFEGSTEPDASEEGCDARPWPLQWAAASGHSADDFHIGEISMPTDGRLTGYLLGAVRVRPTDPNHMNYSNPQIWWFRIDPEARNVLAAGRLTPAVTSSVNGEENAPSERFPCLSSTPDGSASLAYLVRQPGEKEWKLRVVPIRIDPSDRHPEVVGEPPLRILADHCLPSPPAFSKDGFEVYCRQMRENRGEFVGCLPVGPELRGPSLDAHMVSTLDTDRDEPPGS